MTNYNAWQTYFRELKQVRNLTQEFGYRTYFHNLLNSINKNEDIRIGHEPKRLVDVGGQDFVVEQKGVVKAYIETKPLGSEIESMLKSNQIEKYLNFNPNLILTNYHDFILILNKEVVERSTLFNIQDLQSPNSKLLPINVEITEKLLQKFFMKAEPIKTTNIKELALRMADRARILKEYIYELLNKEDDNNFCQTVRVLYQDCKATLVTDLSKDEFADAYSQTVLYGMFLVRLKSKEEPAIYEANRLIPKHYELIKDFFKSMDDYYNEIPPNIKWIFTEITTLVNNTDLESIYKSLSFKDRDYTTKKDPFIHFYEDFLRAYDPGKRKAKGVYYTPIEVVSFITRSINEILINKFGKYGGFADSSVTVLDFAVGTGTFLVSIFEQALETRIGDSQQSLIKSHLLRNFYGFEYLFAPYIIAHLKLSQLLNDYGYEFKDDDRLRVYLTDTLDDSKHQQELHVPILSKEGKQANKIKRETNVLVVTGNPPYSVKSKNNTDWTRKYLKDYKPKDERNIQPLNDDYIKFIRFAHWKIQQTGQGVIGIITNNSFLNGSIHRKMRGELLKDFDEIYILNVYGSTVSNNEIPDENVFDIQVGVAISLLVKHKSNSQSCSVYYKDLCPNTKSYKEKWLIGNDISTLRQYNEWELLNIDSFNKEFRKTRWGQKRFIDDLNFFVPIKDSELINKYGDFWGINEIFSKHNIGIATGRDVDYVSFNPEAYAFDQFDPNKIESYMYRIFDQRFIYYDVDKLQRARYRIMKHFLLGENLGLLYLRMLTKSRPSYFFVTNKLTDRHMLDTSSDSMYVAPLYLYLESSENDLFESNGGYVKVPNFTPEFNDFINTVYQNMLAPEDILGYIYAVMYSDTYRNAYLEYLKIDFPRIPFIENERKFRQLSELGKELIDYHLMKKFTASVQPTYMGTGNNDIVEKVEYKLESTNSVGKVYINNDKHFDNIPQQVWEYYIGGYQVLDKWLKSRKGRELSYEEQQTFEKIVKILYFTISQSDKIDGIIDKEFLQMTT